MCCAPCSAQLGGASHSFQGQIAPRILPHLFWHVLATYFNVLHSVLWHLSQPFSKGHFLLQPKKKIPLERSEEETPFCDSYHLPTLLPLLSLLQFFLKLLLHLPLLSSFFRQAPLLTSFFSDIARKWFSPAHLFPWVHTSSWPQLHLKLLLCSTLDSLALSWLPLP